MKYIRRADLLAENRISGLPNSNRSTAMLDEIKRKISKKLSEPSVDDIR
jgi:hypothetical protein